MSKRKRGNKVRVDFRANRNVPRRAADWTGQYQRSEDEVLDTERGESVRARGALSRKRTVLLDDDGGRATDDSAWRVGRVTAVHGLVCRVDDEQGQSWDCTVRRLLRTMHIDHRSPVTVGDRVWFLPADAPADAPALDPRHAKPARPTRQSRVAGAAGSSDAGSRGPRAVVGTPVGVIERVDARASCLSRSDRRGREHVLVANCDQIVIVASVAQPRLKPHLVDRYLVAAHRGNLRPIICFNKSDLSEVDADYEDESYAGPRLTVHELYDEYTRLGYTCLHTSATTGAGIDELRAALRGHISVLSGQSGVGKSSLINAVEPGLELAVGEVSAENEKGRHTTSHARLLRLSAGGYVVDTPGIRQFDLWAVAPGELEAYFIEFVPLVAQCRFSDCFHDQAEGCAVQAAVEAGEISARRYLSYVKMLGEVEQKQRDWE
ncbi:MAG: ribosome small subunit-dependent GTPase A [Phycisphaerae bacterium]